MLGFRRCSVVRTPPAAGPVEARAAGRCGLLALVLAAQLSTGCGPAVQPVDPPWSAAASAVTVLFSDDKADCAEMLSMGNVEGVSKLSEKQVKDGMKATLDSALSWLRHETAQRGANAVRVLSHRPSDDGGAYLIMGEAFYCRRGP